MDAMYTSPASPREKTDLSTGTGTGIGTVIGDTGTDTGTWRWLWSASLLLLALLVLPGQPSTGGQGLPVGKAERVLPGEAVLLSSQDGLRQWRRPAADAALEQGDEPAPELLFSLFLPPLVAAIALLVALWFVAPSSFFLLPVVVRPGAPRGPPAGALFRL